MMIATRAPPWPPPDDVQAQVTKRGQVTGDDDAIDSFPVCCGNDGDSRLSLQPHPLRCLQSSKKIDASINFASYVMM